jgi:hypothetical protein
VCCSQNNNLSVLTTKMDNDIDEYKKLAVQLAQVEEQHKKLAVQLAQAEEKVETRIRLLEKVADEQSAKRAKREVIDKNMSVCGRYVTYLMETLSEEDKQKFTIDQITVQDALSGLQEMIRNYPPVDNSLDFTIKMGPAECKATYKGEKKYNTLVTSKVFVNEAEAKPDIDEGTYSMYTIRFPKAAFGKISSLIKEKMPDNVEYVDSTVLADTEQLSNEHNRCGLCKGKFLNGESTVGALMMSYTNKTKQVCDLLCPSHSYHIVCGAMLRLHSKHPESFFCVHHEDKKNRCVKGREPMDKIKKLLKDSS